MTSSESPTHPDAPRADGETPSESTVAAIRNGVEDAREGRVVDRGSFAAHVSETPDIDLEATLKPCPFCGGDEANGYLEVMNENEGIGNENGGEATPYYRVVCHECNGLTEGGRLESHAIAAWNRRAALPALLDRPAPSEEIMRLVAACHDEEADPTDENVVILRLSDLSALLARSGSALLARHRDGERAEIGLPPDESPQRNAVCDALTEALLYLGNLAYEADERTVLDLRDEGDMRGLARLLTVRDAKGRDGSLGENTRNLWARIGKALVSAPPSPERASK